LDTDAEVERRAHKKIADIFVQDGEAVFRSLEREAVHDALVQDAGVVSLGGGAILDEATRGELHAFRAEGGHIVFLDVSLTAVAPRLGLTAARPLLAVNPRKQWTELMEQRRPLYVELATVTVNTDHLDAARIAREIVAATS
jgi:shikimate kinase